MLVIIKKGNSRTKSNILRMTDKLNCHMNQEKINSIPEYELYVSKTEINK